LVPDDVTLQILDLNGIPPLITILRWNNNIAAIRERSSDLVLLFFLSDLLLIFLVYALILPAVVAQVVVLHLHEYNAKLQKKGDEIDVL
jgi:hypothetical protein